MDRRQQRGHLLAQDPRVKHVEGAMWFVPSERAGGYLVNVEAGTCSCPDHTGHGARCKHLVAVELVRGAVVKTDDAPVPVTVPEKPAPPAWPRRGDLTAEEQGHVRVALRFVRTLHGWDALVKGTRFSRKSLENVAYGTRPSGSLAIRLARFAGVG